MFPMAVMRYSASRRVIVIQASKSNRWLSSNYCKADQRRAVELSAFRHFRFGYGGPKGYAIGEMTVMAGRLCKAILCFGSGIMVNCSAGIHATCFHRDACRISAAPQSGQIGLRCHSHKIRHPQRLSPEEAKGIFKPYPVANGHGHR